MSAAPLPVIRPSFPWRTKALRKLIYVVTDTRTDSGGPPVVEILSKFPPLAQTSTMTPASVADEVEKRIAVRLELNSLAVADDVARRLEPALGRAPIQPRLLTIEEAAIYIGRSKGAVEEMLRAGKLPYVSPDRRKHIDRNDLDRWIESNKS